MESPTALEEELTETLKTYIINLRRRTDRKKRIMSILPKVLDPEFTSEWDVNFDWKTISWGHLKKFDVFPWKIESGNPWWNRPLRKGEVACAMAHLECWRRGESNGEERFLVLEDDVSFSPNFSTKLRAALEELHRDAPGWQMLYLGRERLSPDISFSNNLVKPGYSYGAYSYVLSHSGAALLLGTGYEKAIIPVDEFLSALFADHPRNDVLTRYPKRLEAYALTSDLVLPPDELAWGSDTEQSDFLNATNR